LVDETIKGTFVPQGHNDILTKAIGTPSMVVVSVMLEEVLLYAITLVSISIFGPLCYCFCLLAVV